MLFDVQGQLNSMNLAESKALWPLFEAVVNSIQAIEESPNKDSGKITILAEREPATQEQLSQGQKRILEKFESFTITDNGTGFNKANYESFQTAYSTHKIKKGCKGIGRFLWLKAFNAVEIHSVFYENGQYMKRDFSFTAEKGISPEQDNVTSSDKKLCGTSVKLCEFIPKYRNKAPVELDVVAKKIIEHCLPFFISGNCPQITIQDGITTPINLNQYFQDNIQDSLHQDHFQIKDSEFTIYHVRLPEGADAHRLHFCANMQEVESVELKNYIPNLQKRIVPPSEPAGFFYVGYIVSSYLDSIVNVTRTKFDYDEKDAQISLTGTGKDSILSVSLDAIKGYLCDYLSDIDRKKHEQIDNFVANERPTYRYLLHKRPEVYDKIPAELKAEALDLELHKHVQIWERELKQQGKQLEREAKEAASDADATFQERFEKYWSGVTDLSKTCLAEYVTRRKTILTILEDALTIQDNGRFKKEDVIHTIICPMRHTSNDITFEEMNLWIIDERLAYHRFLASDKTIKSLPEVDSSSTKEVDLAVFDRAFAYTDDDSPLNTITIVEFKKPDNKRDNPISQMGGYIDEITHGHKKRANGLSFGDCSKTAFRCYAVCDLTPRMIRHCRDAGLRITPDGMGYYGYQPERNAYFEVISYPKLLADAKKRNRILFDKLFEAKPGEVIHIPDVKEAK